MSTKPMTVRVRSVPPCVGSQIGSRHLPLKQGIVSSILTRRTKYSGCGSDAVSSLCEVLRLSASLRCWVFNPHSPPRCRERGDHAESRPNCITIDHSHRLASLVQLVQDTAPPALGHRFESGTMLQLSVHHVSARRQAAKAPDCKSGTREFESHRALHFSKKQRSDS